MTGLSAGNTATDPLQPRGGMVDRPDGERSMSRMILAVTLAAFAAPARTPQERNPAVETRPARAAHSLLDDAELLPAETLGFVRIAPLAGHAAAIAAVPFLREWGNVTLPSQIETQLAQFTNLVRDHLAISPVALRTIAANGFTVALLPADQGTWHFMALLDPKGSGDALDPERLAKLAEQSGGTSRSERIGAAAVHVLQPANRPVYYLGTARGRLVVASTASAWAGITETHSESGHTLGENPRFRSWHEVASSEGANLVTAWLDLREFVAQTLGRNKSTPGLAALVPLLKLDSLGSLGFTAQVRGGEIHDSIRIDLAAPRQQLLAALLGEGVRIRPGLASLVPATASSWSILTLDLAQVWQEGIQLASEIDQKVGKSLDAELRSLQQRLGFDIERDLVGNLGTELLCFGQPRAEGRTSSPEFAVLIPVHNSPRLADALTRLAQTFEIRTSAAMVANKRVLRMALPGCPPDLEPCFHVGDTHLVFATSPALLEKAIVQLTDAPENRPVQDFLSNLPPGTNSVAWTETGEALRTIWDRIAAQVPGNPELPQPLARLRGTARSLMTVDKAGVTWRSSSPIGDVALLGLLAGTASWFAPRLLENPFTSVFEGTPRPGTTANSLPAIARLVAELGEAQESWKQLQRKNGSEPSGSYGTFADLLGAGLIQPDQLGKQVDDQTREVHDHLLRILLPSSPVERVSHFAVVAWPASKHTGLVWCATPQRHCASNDLIARSLGITSIDARDVWVEGRFSGPMSTGWRDVAVPSSSTSKAPAPSPDEKLVALLDALEKNGKKGKSSPELLLALEHQSTEVRARAAFLAGQLAIADAVPKLCTIVTNEPDTAAGRQAMATLAKLVDPRGRQAAIAALGCKTVETRAAAAFLLGKIRAQDAIDPLVNFLAGSGSEGGEDRIQALTALADIGVAACLVPAASACRSDDKKVGAALAYLFQSLSSKLAPTEEAPKLMAVLEHPAPLLRRYAIQRLGELKEKSATAALEGRLAKEEPALQPLVRNALDAIRGPSATAVESPNAAEGVVRKLTLFWERQTPAQRTVLGGIVGVVVVVVLLSLLLVVRMRRMRAGEAWASKVAPSPEFVDRHDVGAPFADTFVEPSVVAEELPELGEIQQGGRPQRRLTPRRQ